MVRFKSPASKVCTITVKDLTERIGKPAGEILKKLLMLGIMAKVKLVAPKSITRSEGKAVRIIDNRKI